MNKIVSESLIKVVKKIMKFEHVSSGWERFGQVTLGGQEKEQTKKVANNDLGSVFKCFTKEMIY